jgi:GH35 family endo-1,4-beta-xylanase
VGLLCAGGGLVVLGQGLAGESVADVARLLADTDARIRQHRTAPLVIEVRDEAGKPMAGARVRVDHVKHRFLFGAGFDTQLLPADRETEVDLRHREQFLKLFNSATVHLYWGSYEPRRGEPQHEARNRCVQWLHAHGLAARGHPVFWNHRAAVPRWVVELNPAPDELRSLLDGRLAQLSQTVLPGLRDVDVFNELSQWERFDNPFTRLLQAQGKVAIAAHYLKEVKRLNPALLTVVNDYETSPRYAALLRDVIAAGAPVDIIGQQSHMHGGNWSFGQLWTILERLSALERPVLFTELSVLSGPRREIDWKTESRLEGWETDGQNEAAQADYLEEFYRVAFSHPNCLGIVLWNYSDRRAWLGAPVGILRKDGTPKPACLRLDALINQRWRTRGDFVTDAHGQVVVPAAFEGTYELRHGARLHRGEHRAGAPWKPVITPQ